MKLVHSRSLIRAGTLLPVFVCLGVGLFHLPLVLNDDFSVHGGGLFGMFSTLDSRVHRSLEASLQSGTRKVNIELDTQAVAVDALLAYPSADRMLDFATYLACFQQPELAGNRITLTYQKDEFADPRHEPEVYSFPIDVLCNR